jgi:hypothetical protein
MFSHSAWHKKRFAENAEYREKVRAARRRYRETHKQDMRERRRLKLQNDPDFRARARMAVIVAAQAKPYESEVTR